MPVLWKKWETEKGKGKEREREKRGSTGTMCRSLSLFMYPSLSPSSSSSHSIHRRGTFSFFLRLPRYSFRVWLSHTAGTGKSGSAVIPLYVGIQISNACARNVRFPPPAHPRHPPCRGKEMSRRAVVCGIAAGRDGRWRLDKIFDKNWIDKNWIWNGIILQKILFIILTNTWQLFIKPITVNFDLKD